MIKSIDETIDHLCALVRVLANNNPLKGEDTEQKMIQDLDMLDQCNSYQELHHRRGVWWHTISIHSYQTDYLIESFIKHKFISVDDVSYICNTMNLDRYVIRAPQFMEGVDIIYERQFKLGGDDELLNILNI